jgi:hypothetical protein
VPFLVVDGFEARKVGVLGMVDKRAELVEGRTLAREQQCRGCLEVGEMLDAEKAHEEVDTEDNLGLEGEEEGFQVCWMDVHELEVESDFQDN